MPWSKVSAPWWACAHVQWQECNRRPGCHLAGGTGDFSLIEVSLGSAVPAGSSAARAAHSELRLLLRLFRSSSACERRARRHCR